MKGTDFRDLFMIYAKENTNRIRKYLKAGVSHWMPLPEPPKE